jgi:hypothetical protein
VFIESHPIEWIYTLLLIHARIVAARAALLALENPESPIFYAL